MFALVALLAAAGCSGVVRAGTAEVWTHEVAGVRSQYRVGGGLLPDSALGLTEVVWLGPERNGLYLGSPSIAQDPATGTLLATHDYFGTSTFGTTVQVFASTDGGSSWAFRANVTGIYWANIFSLNNTLYMMGVSGGDHDHGKNIVITQSTDLGVSWLAPIALVEGDAAHDYHCGPTPALVASDGNIYRAFEVTTPTSTYAALMVWAPLDLNILQPSSWRTSNILPFTNSWIPKAWNATAGFGWQEGNAVQLPDGSIGNMLRLDGQTTTVNNKAVLTSLNTTTGVLSFRTFVDFPSCSSKFVIQQSPATKTFYTLSTNVTRENIAINSVFARNNLVLAASEDLLHWRVCQTLLTDDTGFPPEDSAKYTGFHYVSWIFDEDDILYVVRTGYRGSNSYHNSNRMTFKRLFDYKGAC